MDSYAIQELNKSILTLEECNILYTKLGHYAVIENGMVVALLPEE